MISNDLLNQSGFIMIFVKLLTYSHKQILCIKFQVQVKSLQKSLAEAEGALDEMDDLKQKLKEAEEELESKYQIFP